jgi:hypothetical protein
MLGRECPGAIQVACRDRDDFDSQRFIGRGHDAARRDSRSAEDADAYHGASLA